MLGRVRSLMFAVYVSSLAVMVLSTGGAALAAGACIEMPNRQIDRAGHWYYHVDRAHHRRCWYFETSEVAVRPASSPDPRSYANADREQSWFSWLTAGLQQTFSLQAYQNSMPDDSGAVTPPSSPKPAKSVITSSKPAKTVKVARKERPRLAPVSETNGAASVAWQNQMLSQAPERVEKYAPAVTPVDRVTLFENFLQWYAEKSMLSGK